MRGLQLKQHVPTVSVGVGSVKGSVKNAPTQGFDCDATRCLSVWKKVASKAAPQLQYGFSFGSGLGYVTMS